MSMPSDEIKYNKRVYFNTSFSCFNIEKLLNKLSKTKSKNFDNKSLSTNLSPAASNPLDATKTDLELKEYIVNFIRNLNYLSILSLTYYNNKHHPTNEGNANFILFKKQLKRDTFEKIDDLNKYLKRRIPVFNRPIRTNKRKRLSYFKSLNSIRSVISNKKDQFKKIKWSNMLNKMVQP